FFFFLHQNLYIQGKGDPFLVSEYIKEISQNLFKKGLSTIKTVILDTSFFTLSSPPDGSQNSHNPYDVPNGALCVNFNSLPIAISELGTISSFESQTPHIPLMEEIGKQLTKGKHRVNVNGFKISSNLSNMNRYTGELFVAFLRESGISVDGHIVTGKVPDSAHLIHTSLSKKNITDLVSENLKYSNNFITNQLLLTCAVKSGIEHVTWAAASTLMKHFIIDETGIATEELYIAEGSGLSRNNRVTSLAMLKILNAFRPYAHLLPKKNGIILKSGTLKDTYCYVGYFISTSQLDPFVIFLNQKNNNRNQLLDLLAKEYRIQ
ncbi:MAG: peptidase S13, partial [Desulfobacteraceae bacterium]|nr:peptidase S13 [Desulfobacteraceae bacterium]